MYQFWNSESISKFSSDPEVVVVCAEEKEAMCNFFAFVPEVRLIVKKTKDQSTGVLETSYECTPGNFGNHW